MFVMVSISPDRIRNSPENRLAAFTTPTIAYFTTALVVSAVMLVPHLALRSVAVLIGGVAISGLAYLVWVKALRHWREAKLDQDDLLFYVVLPYAGYLALLVAAAGLWTHGSYAALTLALASVLMLVIGIRNAWDLVIFMARSRAG
jgi:hypothetical protein